MDGADLVGVGCEGGGDDADGWLDMETRCGRVNGEDLQEGRDPVDEEAEHCGGGGWW